MGKMDGVGRKIRVGDCIHHLDNQLLVTTVTSPSSYLMLLLHIRECEI